MMFSVLFLILQGELLDHCTSSSSLDDLIHRVSLHSTTSIMGKAREGLRDQALKACFFFFFSLFFKVANPYL